MKGTSIIAKFSMPLKGGCTGSYESTRVKMPHCSKSHDAAHYSTKKPYLDISKRRCDLEN